MRFRGLISLAVLNVTALTAVAADHTPPPVTPAGTFAAVETHDKEKLAIAVEPYDTKDKQAIFHFDYTKVGVMPVRLIVTNLGDRTITLRDARILFETADGERIQAADPEDVERLMNPREPRSTLPIPGPIPGVKLKRSNHYKDVEKDFDIFEYRSELVEPHTTRSGFLFYVMPVSGNPLRGADMYINKLRVIGGEDLFPFQIPFDKYLQGKAGGVN